MERFTPEALNDGWDWIGVMKPDPNGEYVKFSDIQEGYLTIEKANKLKENITEIVEHAKRLERIRIANMCYDLMEARFATGHIREGSMARTIGDILAGITKNETV